MPIAHRAALAVHRRAVPRARSSTAHLRLPLQSAQHPFPFLVNRNYWQNQNEATAQSQKSFQRLAITTFHARRALFLTKQSQTPTPIRPHAHTPRHLLWQLAQRLNTRLNLRYPLPTSSQSGGQNYEI